MIENNVKALHQAELIELAHEIVNDEFSLATRALADESMAELNIDLMDVINVLRTCNAVTMDFAKWPCAEYHGRTLDGDPLVVVAVIHHPEKTVKFVKVWKKLKCPH